MIKALLDIDVILDVLESREGFYFDSFAVLNLCALGEIEGWISADSHSTIHYFLRKQLGEKTAREEMICNLRQLSVIPVRRHTLHQALDSKLPDFEDNIKIACAEAFHLDFIISRNSAHYKMSPVPALTPTEVVRQVKSGLLSTDVRSVPFLDLKAQHHQVYNEIDDRMTDIIANTGFILGKHVDEFEERFAELQGARYCIGVSSGTDALHIALLALGIGAGDRVLVPVNTFIATAEAVSLAGAQPVFVDCDEYYNIDVANLRKLLESEEGKRADIKAVIPVHLYGQPANMDAVMAIAEEFSLAVVEDCAQAHLAAYDGKRVGNFGRFGAFSFYPGKNLGAYGEAGALITNDEELYTRAKMIRQHGEIKRYHHQLIGHNYRMEAIQGAVLAAKLKYLEEWTQKRQANARLYSELLKDVPGVQVPRELPKASSVYHLYVVQVEKRDELQKHLLENGIVTGLHYPVPLHLQKAYAFMGHKQGDFPAAEAAAGKILSLPMYPELTERQVRCVVDVVKRFSW